MALAVLFYRNLVPEALFKSLAITLSAAYFVVGGVASYLHQK